MEEVAVFGPSHPRRTEGGARRASSRRVLAGLAACATLSTGAVAGASTAAAAPILPVPPAARTQLLAESFAQAALQSPSWVRPTPWGNTACLTASWDGAGQPIPGCGGDAPGAGVLRLTSSTSSQVGSVFFDSAIPSAQGLDVTFDSYQWDTYGPMAADGLGFVLAATDPAEPAAPAHAGLSGSGLGYLGRDGVDGVPHGYLGVGLDVLGGYAASGADRGDACVDAPGSAQSVTVRGPGDGTTGYCPLGTTASDGLLNAPSSRTRPVAVPVTVSLNPAAAPVVNGDGDLVPAGGWLVAWTSHDAARQVMTGALPTDADLTAAGIPTSWVDPVTRMPYQLSLGWTGSTGAWGQNQAIGNVHAATLTGQLPVYGLGATDDTDGVVDPGVGSTLTLTPSLSADGGAEDRPATLTTRLPDALVPGTVVSDDYACTTSGQLVSCTLTADAARPAGTSLPALVVPVAAADGMSGPVTVTAKVSSTDGNPATVRHDLVVRAAQSLTVAPLASPARVGSSQDVVASGGGGTAPVVLSLAGSDPGACALDGTTLTLTGAGTCSVTASQAGDAGYAPATPVTQSVAVERVPTTVTATPDRTAAVSGQDVTLTVTPPAGVAGTLVALVDGRPGAPVHVDAGSDPVDLLVADGGDALLGPGSHPLAARFTPDDSVTYAGSESSTTTLVVDKATTTTVLAVGTDRLTATVSTRSPGSGTPTGSVGFLVDGRAVGTSTLVDGVATLAYRTAPGASRQVAAVYGGDDLRVGSSDSTARMDPSLTATVSSASAPSRWGWYRTPVTVTFACRPASAPLTAPCPAPVTFSRNGAGQSVTRTVTATDGGVATATVTRISVDRTAPAVAISGIRDGGRYLANTSAARCVASDSLSGVASCTLTRTRSGVRERVTATAVDRAGNRTSRTVTVEVRDVVVVGATYRDGVYTVRRGQTYTVLAVSSVRPRYVDAALAPRRPHGEDAWFTRTSGNQWGVVVTMDRGMRLGSWNLGVRRGSTLTVVPVRVVG